MLVAWRASASAEILARDARAVVVHLHALHAALGEGHLDLGGAGIQAVLEQFFQHRGRPLDHFAGRDLAHQQLRHRADGAHAKSI